MSSAATQVLGHKCDFSATHRFHTQLNRAVLSGLPVTGVCDVQWMWQSSQSKTEASQPQESVSPKLKRSKTKSKGKPENVTCDSSDTQIFIFSNFFVHFLVYQARVTPPFLAVFADVRGVLFGFAIKTGSGWPLGVTRKTVHLPQSPMVRSVFGSRLKQHTRFNWFGAPRPRAAPPICIRTHA